MTPDLAIHVRGLGRSYRGRRVLDGVDLDVRPGEAVALLGANGAGKTTLLRVLATLVRPSRGTARVAGFDCAGQAGRVREHMTLLAHGAWVYDDLTPVENLRFWSAMAGRRPDRPTLLAALAAVDLERVAHERVRTFSAGMKRRLGLARLWLARPAVLLLDEPFAGLDQQAGKWLEDHLVAARAGGTAVLMATHSYARGLAAADRVAILAGGRVTLDTPLAGLGPDDVRRLYELHAAEAP